MPSVDPVPAPKKIPEAPPEKDTNDVVGDFIINGYENNKNDWHFVKVSVLDEAAGTFRWTNRAGVKWTLTKTESPDILEVGDDCPYFSSGYTEAELKFKDGKVFAIAGPWGEIYTKLKVKAAPEPVALETAIAKASAQPAADKIKNDCAKLKAAADTCKANKEKAKEEEENKKEQEKEKEADKGKKEEEKTKKDKEAKDKTKEEEKKKEENKDEEEKKTNDKKKKETDEANKKKKEEEK